MKCKFKSDFIVPVLALILAITGMILPVSAETGPTFSVDPVYPENQRAENGYFDLLMAPGQQQELTIRISNSDSAEAELEIELVNASTAPDGFIDYTTPNVRDDSLQYPFEEIANLQQKKLTVPAGGTAEAVVSIQMPDEEFDGKILGGIRILKPVEEAGESMITNEYQYAIAVALTMNDNVIAPDFELLDVSSGLEYYRAAVIAEIRNFKPATARSVDVEANLYRQGVQEAVYTITKTISMAPNSVWQCQMIDDAGYGFDAGSYTYRIRMELDGELWEFERDFTISGTEAEHINRNAVNQQNSIQQSNPRFSMWTWILILLILVLVVVFIVFWVRRRKEKI